MEAVLTWTPTDNHVRAAWANVLDATRDGAYAVVIAATELVHGLYAVARAEHATGADYYLARPDTRLDDLEDWLRLEVSGMDSGSTSDLERRLSLKVEQAAAGGSNLPALAGVVGFKLRCVMTARVKETATG